MDEYFRGLRSLSQKIDSDIENLDKTWASPHLLVGGYGDNSKEAEPYVEDLLSNIKDLQDLVIADRESRERLLSDTEKDLSTVETFCDQLKHDCKDVETLLSYWGCKPVPDNSESVPSDESETESGILLDKSTIDSPCPNNVERNKPDVFFTPSLKATQPKSIATPVIRSVASVIKSEQQNRTNISSSLDRPSTEFLSPYYGTGMK